MGFLRSGHKSSGRRRGALLGLAVGAAAVLAVAIPGGAASAGKPLSGNPQKPIVDDWIGDTPVRLTGYTNNSNLCAGIYCHTYIGIMVKTGSSYGLFDGWKDITGLPGSQHAHAVPLPGTNWYKTTVHDFVTTYTPDGCGKSSKTFYGKTYKRFSCDGMTTTYIKIYSSPAAKVVVPV